MPDLRGSPCPNIEDIGRTFDFFYVPGAALEVRILDSDRGTISGYFNDREKFVAAVQSLAGRGPSTLINMNPGHPDLLARAYNRMKFWVKLTTADKDILRRRFLLIDCDAIRIAGISATNSEHDYALERLHHIVDVLRSEGFPAPGLGDSGNGGHALFGLDMANDEHSGHLLRNVLKALAGRFDDPKVKIDQAVHNAARICKLYGTPVGKGDNRPERPHRLSKWLEIPKEFHPVPVALLEELARTSAPATSSTTKGANRPTVRPSRGKRKFDLDAFMVRHNIQTRPAEAYEGGRIFRLAACLFNAEHGGKDAAIIERADGTLCYHCFHNSCSDRDWKNVRELFEGPRPTRNGSTNDTGSTPASPPAESARDLPVINAGDYQLRDAIAQSLSALRAAQEAALSAHRDSDALFTRGGHIVEIVKSDDRTVILDATDSMVRRRLSLAADYICYVKNSTKGVPPPVDVTRGVIDTHPGEEWGLLPVDAVVEVPVFRPDGTVIDRIGYDASTRLYYAPAPDVSNIRVPLFPTKEEVVAAAELLQEVLVDFRFVDEASRTNVIAALITLFVRSLIRGCVPGLALDATTQGTGKTLIAKIIALILTGKAAILHAAPHEPEEWRKKLTAILRYGPAVIFFDNVVHPLSNDALSCALTSGVYADRILGFSERVEMAVRCLLVFTGNNLKAVGDMERRVFWARQDPRVSDPENRSGFRHPELGNWVLEHRARLIGAVLILVRSWFVAGQPRSDINRGSFEDWAQTIGGILENAGIHHFLANRSTTYASDTDMVEFGAFLLEIKQAFKEPFLTIDLVKALSDQVITYHALREALPDWMREKSKEEGQFCAFLGNVFSKRLDKRHRPSGIYITRDGNTGGKARWKIVVPAPSDQQTSTTQAETHGTDDPRSGDVPPQGSAAPEKMPNTTTYLEIKGRGRTAFPSPEAADAFRTAHPEVVE